ncbi:unnamed protein product [Linum tenue]|uniref:F-box domain-containing protein n=1 Tax=Linum tenue TaxID=586396 RepID=A0AAV0NQ03_9ROSI|nr:unnamed protein product [Linum tenue]
MNKKRKAGKERRRDRLTPLPEHIIHHILSFLDTRSAVQTSVLSRSWRSAWKYVPALHFNQYSFQHYSSFHLYVRKVLSLRHPLNLSTVKFVDDECRSDGRDDSLVIRVIQYALSHDAQHLVIYHGNDITSADIYRFSDLFGSISNCDLKVLVLDGFDLDSGFGSPHGFRMLTNLILEACMVAGQDLEPFSNFPCLQHLVLSDFHSDERNCSMKIYGLELLSLKLHTVCFSSIDIDVPKLEFLSIWDDEVEMGYLSFSNLSLPSLQHADIRLHGDLDCIEETKEYMMPQLIYLFQGLHNAKSLKLYEDTTIPVMLLWLFLLEIKFISFVLFGGLVWWKVEDFWLCLFLREEDFCGREWKLKTKEGFFILSFGFLYFLALCFSFVHNQAYL